MAKITIDTDALLQGAADVMDHTGIIRDTTGRLIELIARMSGAWQGESCVSYINSVQNIIRKTEQTANAMEEYSNYVKESAEKFSQLDRDSANRIRSCF